MKTTASLLRLLLFFVLAIILIEWVYNTGEEWAMLTQPVFWAIIGTAMLFAIAFEICIEA